MLKQPLPLSHWTEPAVPEGLSQALAAQPGFALWARGARLRVEELSAERVDGGVVRRFAAPFAGLEVHQAIEVDAGHGAVVLRLTLVQDGDVAGLPLERIDPLHLMLEAVRKRLRGPFHILTVGGGTNEGYYPPLAFRENRVSVLERGPSDAFRIGSGPGGRSSEQTLPFLMLQLGPEGEPAELVASLEWSGEWEMEVNCGVPGLLDRSYEPRDDLYVVGGPRVSGLVLDPGEELELPPVHMVFFEGDLDDGCNALRRYIRERIAPSLDGAPPLPTVSYDTWYGLGPDIDEESTTAQVERCAELGVEYFVVDAGWFPSVEGQDFSRGVGNWRRVDATKFPRGLEPLAEAVRRRGMKLGLWFDVERASRDSDVGREHPEWLWDIGEEYLHLDLGLPKAQEYVVETISDWATRLDLGWIKLDYNISPGPYWRHADPTGKVQFAYMRGLYRVLDELMRRHPAMVVENCSSGGLRIDLGTLRRSHANWLSDHADEPHISRYMQIGAGRFLPGNLLSSAVPAREVRRDLPNAGLEFLSRMPGTLAFNGNVAAWTPEVAAEGARHVRAYKAVRHLLMQDSYRLTPQPATESDWEAVQYTSHDGTDAVVFAFRMAGDEPQRHLRLKGLLPGREYDVTDLLGDGAPASYASQTLADHGLPVTLDRHQGRAFRLRVRG